MAESLQPRPTASSNDVPDSPTADAVLPRQRCLLSPRTSEGSTNRPNIVRRELLVRGTLPLKAISGVVARGSDVEMPRVHAGGHIAGVQDPLALRDGAVVQEPRDTVSTDHALLLGIPDDTVPEGLLRTCLPKPAVVRPSYFDLGPEAIGQWRSVRCSAHGLRAPRSLPAGVVHSAPSPRLDLDWAFAPVDVAHEGDCTL